MMKILCENGKAVFSKEVDSYLPELSKRGSGDDASVACAVSWKKLQQRNKQGIIQRKWKIADNQYSLEQLKAKSNELLLRKEYLKSINDSDSFNFLRQQVKKPAVFFTSTESGDIHRIPPTSTENPFGEGTSLFQEQICQRRYNRRVCFFRRQNKRELSVNSLPAKN